MGTVIFHRPEGAVNNRAALQFGIELIRKKLFIFVQITHFENYSFCFATFISDFSTNLTMIFYPLPPAPVFPWLRTEAIFRVF